MLNNKVTVSVIIPHFQDLDGLDKCLHALTLQSYESGAAEIIVADNDSKEGASVLQRVIAGRARLTICTQPGAGPTRNAGAKLATGETLAFIDSDCVPSATWLEAGTSALQTTDVVGGHVSVSVRDERNMSATEAYERVFAFDIENYVRTKHFVGSGNMFVRRSTFEKVGGFGTGLSEDVDWSHRALANGFVITYCRLAAVAHPARTTWAELKRKFFRVDRELLELSKKTRVGPILFLIRTWAMPLSPFVHIFKIVTSPSLNRFQDRLLATIILFRLRLWRFWDGTVIFVRGL